MDPLTGNVAQAEAPSAVLNSLPAEAKEHIEDLQKARGELNDEFNLPLAHFA